MTELEFVKWAMLAMLSLGVFFMKRTLDHIEKSQEEQMLEIKRIKEEYLHKTDFTEWKLELRIMFEEIRKDIRSLRKE